MPLRIAAKKRSAGSCFACGGGPRHQASAPTLARLLAALIQNGAATPAAVVITPPSAGPIARLMLMPTLLAATACASSSRGTRSGTIDWYGGAPAGLHPPRRAR